MSGVDSKSYGNCWLVTMDDAGTEHRHGWIRIEDGLVAETGSGEAPGGAEDLGGLRADAQRRLREDPVDGVAHGERRCDLAGHVAHAFQRRHHRRIRHGRDTHERGLCEFVGR